MDFQDLEAFIHVARQGGFSQAAAQRRIAQSALSRRVGRLEHQLSVKLFARHGRGVRLTEEGIALLSRAEGLMTELQSIERDVLVLASEPTGDVRLAFTPTAAQILAPLVVEDLRQRWPRITLHIREGFSGSIHDWVVEQKVDLALLYNPESTAQVEVIPFVREPVYLVAPAVDRSIHRHLMKNGQFRLKHIGSLPLILPSHSHSLRVLLERFAAERRLALNIVNEVDGMRATKGMVEAGLGYTFFSYAGVYEEVLGGSLKIFPVSPALSWYLALVQRHNAPRSRALLEVRKTIEKKMHLLLRRGLWQGELLSPRLEKVPSPGNGTSATRTSPSCL
jgi:LysR family nitrogen assimilation transcriptional regulator